MCLQHTCCIHDSGVKKKCIRPCSQNLIKDTITSYPPPVISQFQVPASQENIHSSHHCLENEDFDPSLTTRGRSKSTPALEDLYAKVMLDSY